MRTGITCRSATMQVWGKTWLAAFPVLLVAESETISINQKLMLSPSSSRNRTLLACRKPINLFPVTFKANRSPDCCNHYLAFLHIFEPIYVTQNNGVYAHPCLVFMQTKLSYACSFVTCCLSIIYLRNPSVLMNVAAIHSFSLLYGILWHDFATRNIFKFLLFFTEVIIDIKHYVSFRYTKEWFDICLHGQLLPTVRSFKIVPAFSYQLANTQHSIAKYPQHAVCPTSPPPP